MNNSLRIRTIGLHAFGAALGCALLLGTAWAQDTTESSTHTGQSTVQTETRTGTVMYVSGNHLVVKTEDGQLRDFTVPDSMTADVDGKQLNVHQLQPGMKLTKTIRTTTTPKTVTTIRTISGKVWFVNPPSTVILSLPDGTNKQYKVPKGQMFMINGSEQTVFHLRKGMMVSATVMTETPEIHQSSTSEVAGVAPPPPPEAPPASPNMVLLVESDAPAPAAPPEEAATALPKTGSTVPLFGLLGLLLIGGSFGIRLARR